MEYPKISIVTPNFNGDSFLEETIESVLSQGYPNLEYIIIDGDSTDRSVEIIKKYESHLSYWISEKDKGQADAINKGMKKCTGDIFNWLNSDDCYIKNCLMTVGKYFYENKNTKVLIGSENYIRNGEIVKHFKARKPLNIEKALAHCGIAQPSTFFDFKTIQQVGPLKNDLFYFFDLEWWVRYLLYFQLDGLHTIEDTLVDFKLHEAAKTAEAHKYFKERKLIIYNILKIHNIEISPNIKTYLQQVFNGTPDITKHWRKVKNINLQKLSFYSHLELMNNFIDDQNNKESKTIAKYLLRNPIFNPREITKCLHTILFR